MRTIYNVGILVALSSICDAARILAVFPAPSISHQVVFRPLIRELVNRHHEVVMITTDPMYKKGEAPKNLTEINVHDISYSIWREQVLASGITSGNSDDIIKQMSLFFPLLSKIFEKQMLTDQVQQVINDRTNHFDLILVEACVRPAISVSHVFKAPVVFVSSFLGMNTNYDVMGVPIRPPLRYAAATRQKIYNLSLWDKLVELYHQFLLDQLFASFEDPDNAMIKRLFGPDTPTINELENNVHLMLLNAYPIWDSNRPVPPSVIYMGGMHQNPSNELPKDLKTYLDSSKHGVIYISFGTNVDPSTLPPEKIQVLTRVFSKLPYDVLWKWNQDELPGRSDNIRISKWLPQSDLLKHPKIRLFITQGGLQSTDEAITAGVPLIGMPMLGDQWYNVEQYIIHKIGLRLDLDTLTEDSFLNGINTILNNDSYLKNIVRLRAVMRDQPEKPLQRAVWWVEHVLRHGGALHLRSPIANMSWADYLDLPLMATLAALSLAVLAIVILSLYGLTSIVKKYVSSGVKLKNN